MTDSFEEFEPLFDYRRVQPVNVISLDDDDEAPITPTKRRKIPNPGKDGKGGAKKVDVHVIDCDEIDDSKEDDDDSWLLPPPFTGSQAGTMYEEDSTIAELRRKREELASFAKSTEDVLRALEESGEREHEASSRPSPKKVDDKPPKASSNRSKIVLSMQGKGGQKQFRVFADDKFESIFKMYAEKIKVDVQKLVFTFDGDKISPTATPLGLEMEDEDQIEVIVKSS